jgi:cobalt-zinc-cadmium efflux system protein
MHAHEHAHGIDRTSAALKLSLLATGAYIVMLVIAGIRSHSLALLSEAGHNASDFLALLLSWVAVYFQSRPPSETKTFGYARGGVLAAFLNALGLVAIAVLIFFEAAQRLRGPEPHIHTTLMIVVAAIGVALNGGITLLLQRTTQDVNIRSVIIHQIGDTLSTAAVIVGGVVIALTGQSWIDAALSFGIGALILWSSFGIVRETLNILLEGTPRGMDLSDIAGSIRKSEGVLDVHDLHVWSIGSNLHALSCHICIADIPPSESERILRDVQERLGRDLHIHHTTIQFEHAVCDVAHGCVIVAEDMQQHAD